MLVTEWFENDKNNVHQEIMTDVPRGQIFHMLYWDLRTLLDAFEDDTPILRGNKVKESTNKLQEACKVNELLNHCTDFTNRTLTI